MISKSLMEHEKESVKAFILSFYARRFVRIVPALLVVLLVASAIHVLFIPSSWLSEATRNTGLAAFLGFSNVALLLSNDGYFSPRVDFNIFTHTWSLGVEEQFYFIFPFLFLFWFLSREKKGISVVSKLILPFLTLISLYFAYWVSDNKSDWGYYLIFSRFWEMAVGAILFKYHYAYNKNNRSVFISTLKIILGLVLVFVGFFLSDKSSFPYPWALLPVFGTLLLIDGFYTDTNKGFVFKAFRIDVLRYIGKISYSLYLWHWVVFTAMRWTVGLESTVEQITAITLSFLLASFSYYAIERPVIRLYKNKNWKPSVTVGFSISCIALSFMISLSLFNNKDGLTLSLTGDKSTWYAYDFAG